MQPNPSRTSSRSVAVVAAVAIALAVGLGVVLRLVDPLSSAVIPAEDPYTHMALVREHLRTGTLDSLSPTQELYPPGLHAFLATAWVYTGLNLYDIILFGPVVLGAIGVLGMGLLLWRSAGPVAGFVAALAMAVMPEAIFRSTMMSPTALDLALLPFLLYALTRILVGRLGWIGIAAPMTLFLAFAHPWLLAILCAAGVVFLVFSFLFPETSARAEPLSMTGIPWCMAIFGAGLGVALAMPNFGLVLPSTSSLMPLGFVVAGAALVPVLVVSTTRASWRTRWLTRAPGHVLVRAAWSLAIAAALITLVTIAVQNGMPPLVNLPVMVGWPILLLACAALVALPFIASPMANLAASLVAVTAPFVLFNPLHSDFLSHRTVVFLGIGLAALAGLAAAGVLRLAVFLLASFADRPTARAATARPSRGLVFAFAPALLVATLFGATVYAATPDSYPGGWYRLYNSCELDGLRAVAALADASPSTIIVTGDWQAKLVLAALTEDASRVWYSGAFYTSEQVRGDLVAQMGHQGRPLMVVLDRHLQAETPGADTGFVESSPWSPAGAWCANMGVPQPRLSAYATGGAPT